MFPMNGYLERCRDALAALDALVPDAGAQAEALEDLNAELDDLLLAFADLRPGSEDFEEELSDLLDDMDALAGDYRALAARGGLAGLADPAERLERVTALARSGVSG